MNNNNNNLKEEIKCVIVWMKEEEIYLFIFL